MGLCVCPAAEQMWCSPVPLAAFRGTFTGQGNRLCHAAQRSGPKTREEVAGEKARAPRSPNSGGEGREKQWVSIPRGPRAARPTCVHLSLVCPPEGVPMLSVQPKGKQKGCAGCNRKIKDRYLLKALDKYWHEDCLKCACCDCRLGEVGSTLYTKANLILCRRDYLRWATSHRLALLLRQPPPSSTQHGPTPALHPVPQVPRCARSSQAALPLPCPCSPSHAFNPWDWWPAQVLGKHL